ncbi:alpha/beta-hydrolase [Penicillium samsonianum]|uniref:alpha/beta-hydrolase n=1 Tax=Penicillium samsonianum TaxID=1882272 RepID=UPI00254765BB|nr:alpha/beta-hydrolase [Penicillium samsonianum]KAJ6118230.1 alpha/beta-hydrolase [Penicillium samsonianum]
MQLRPHLLAATCLLVGINASPLAPVASNAADPTVTIDAGVVIGVATAVTSAAKSSATVYNYLGIPFAAPPTGTRRFAPPAAATPWSKPLEVKSLRPACMQQFPYPKAASELTMKLFNNPGGPPPPESEDCLHLNVYAPTDASPLNKKAVLFWIYGGNLQFGSAYPLFYNGSSFAGFQDTVVVTFNYRTNIFGFPGSPEIPPDEQNSGLLDQRFALQWVQNNIAGFGGDPARVTIVGESAGGESVKQILAQPPSPLPFHAAIMESEGTVISGSAAASWAQTLKKFGCTDIACLRGVPAKDIKKYITEQSVGFPPVENSVSWSTDVRPNIRSKQFAQVPFFMGTNANEGHVFAAVAGIDNTTSIEDFLDNTFPQFPTAVKAVGTFYSLLAHDVYLFASAVITDFLFTCTTSALSQYARAHGYDVWRYHYSAVFPNLNTFPDAGAYHTSEIPQVWGTYMMSNQLGDATPTQEALSMYMQTAWAGFAKDPSAG